MKVILLRHGLTIENKFGIIQGHTEGTLSKEGIIKNNEVSFELKDKQIDSFYSSPLFRAKETLYQILENHKEKQFYFDSRIIEWGMGRLEGKPYPEDFNFYNYLDCIENIEDVKNKCVSFIDDIKAKHSGQTILIVSHGLTIRMLESIILKIDFTQTKLFENSTYKTFHL